MLATRQGALILAVLCAACAAGILIIALSSYKRSVQTTVKQATVLVATGEIQKGTSGDVIAAERLFKSMPIVASQLAPDAVSDSALLQGRVAQADILPGQQLTVEDFTTTASATTLLSPNQRAVSVGTDEVHGDLNVLEPGDRVDVYAALSGPNGEAVSLLVANVLVLKTPTGGLAGAAAGAQSAGGGQSSNTSTLVLAVKSADVQPLELTAEAGHVWLALRPADATPPAPGVATAASVLALGSATADTAGPKSNTNPNGGSTS
jgi:Flp pilus assembly protein CpaB